MKTAAALAMAALIGANLSGADEPRAKAPVTRAALFKNGYALITREIKTTPNKAFLIDEEIKPVHGTLWFAPGQNLTVTRTKQQVEEIHKVPFTDLMASYEGRKVTVMLRAAGNEPSRTVTGTMVRLGDRNDPQTMGSLLVLKQESGQLITFDRSMVALIESDGVNEGVSRKTSREKWVLLVDNHRKESPLQINYVTFGLSWAPAYRIALGKDSKLQIDHSAVITNELEELKNAEVNLISGFPNLEYMRVVSPLLINNLNQFFQSLAAKDAGGWAAGVMSQRVMNTMDRSPMATFGESPLPSAGLSEDIHYTPLGRITLGKDESVYKNIASGQAAYERIVDWEIPDRRDPWGNYRNVSNGEVSPYGDLWDAVRFKNPLNSPLTTAPIEIVSGEKILAQTTVGWTNPGQEALIKITKALTVTGKISEYEVENKEGKNGPKISGRPIVYVGGHSYRNPEVEGTVMLHNYRSTPAKVVARLQFSGELVSAEKEPKAKLLETGIYSVNPRRELTWELTLQPGEELSVKYSYTVLVRH